MLATGQNSIMMDMNSFVWVSKKEIAHLGGAVFSASATLPIANNSLTSDLNGALSGGGGFADSYYQPFILGWRKQRVAIQSDLWVSWRPPEDLAPVPTRMSVQATGPQLLRVGRRYI